MGKGTGKGLGKEQNGKKGKVMSSWIQSLENCTFEHKKWFVCKQPMPHPD
jgi:hypothetical protein